MLTSLLEHQFFKPVFCQPESILASARLQRQSMILLLMEVYIPRCLMYIRYVVRITDVSACIFLDSCRYMELGRRSF